MNPPGVEDWPSPMNQESYQDMVVSGGVGTVLVVVVGPNVVVDLNLINLFCLRRRMRAILSLLCRSALSRALDEGLLLTTVTRLLLTVGFCTLVLL